MLQPPQSGLDPDPNDPFYLEEEAFHDSVRVQIICLLVYILFYLCSYSVIRYYRTRSDFDELYSGDEDYFVYRIAVWICTNSLATAISAIFLLPFSILGTEIRQVYKDNFYIAWLNWDLIYTMWNYVFTFSNISLFILLPFAYFFIESQGFHGARKRLKSRVIEAACVSFFLIIIITCLVDLCYTMFFASTYSSNDGINNSTTIQGWRRITQLHLTVLNFTSVNIPMIYSFCSLIGLTLFLISTPFGFSRIFDWSYNLLIKQQSINYSFSTINDSNENSIDRNRSSHEFYKKLEKTKTLSLRRRISGNVEIITNDSNDNIEIFEDTHKYCFFKKLNPSRNGHVGALRIGQLLNICKITFNLVKYPLLMIAILLLTTIFVLMITINTLTILFGFRSLPHYVQIVEVNSRHVNGIVWSTIEIAVITYMFALSLAGVYSLPFLRRMKPKKSMTSMTSVIGNSTLILCLSSALPVTSKILGITTFDLLGKYGTLTWLSNFSFIWFYNVVFVSITISCLLNKLTLQVRNEIVTRFQYFLNRKKFVTRMEYKDK
ncbi:LMBR1-like membrane protein domain and Lipocalin-1 receptor family-containing protein [Strongyloides ratti]|uniref:LMBR1-like membrane protein domain and Lipocalin-1 receptor family-containing protein n=1 Tax=Strongyloides ratti TaxID=34506 RepID=A0A090L5N2_STRRB|nr:LMBR1-like membrane protein domain and Lipocalin-1 receptor family-containing protein [Strongyloides ratti]CEF65032.1 LMBR1-like membrane protein domain and Lipocalin-1 receptor family-containing protein [Strongyloides ratti]